MGRRLKPSVWSRRVDRQAAAERRDWSDAERALPEPGTEVVLHVHPTRPERAIDRAGAVGGGVFLLIFGLPFAGVPLVLVG
ncbi:MAG TPA: hypothetical protein RMH99_05965 [Sandaracinaceae bacterium LLY-WYZ-13_1]|nr:hypothetical protein [Sandaracinaceae bacterium LLY-WYZ-13_1]